jgi:hypothetical protein
MGLRGLVRLTHVVMCAPHWSMWAIEEVWVPLLAPSEPSRTFPDTVSKKIQTVMEPKKCVFIYESCYIDHFEAPRAIFDPI